jgi:carboxylesterase
LARFKPSGDLVGPGSPRALELDGAAPPVLALHGFGGTPLEVELVVDVARALGLAASAPLLPGHGTHARELAKSTWKDWEAAAAQAFERLAARGPVLVTGLSLGSLLAAHLAATRPERVRALVLLANAAWLSAPFPRWPLEAIRALGVRDFWMPKAGPDIADPQARRTHLTYDAQPVHAAFEVLDAGRLVRAELGRVTCPTLIVHGARDRVCPVSNAHRAAGLVGTSDRRVVILPRSRHIVTRDVDRAELERELTQFFSHFISAARRHADG